MTRRTPNKMVSKKRLANDPAYKAGVQAWIEGKSIAAEPEDIERDIEASIAFQDGWFDADGQTTD